MRFRVANQAALDLGEIESFIRADNPAAAVKFIEKLEGTFRQLAQSPGIGRRRSELSSSLRSIRVSEYLIFYCVHEQVLEVVRVIHGKRDLKPTDFPSRTS